MYERDIWFEDRLGRMDPDKDLDGVDVLMITALINETPRAYELARQARHFHPHLVILGGGPQMSPLADEAFARGGFDVIVNREGEDIIGQLCDILLTWRDDRKYQYLERVAGISFIRDGRWLRPGARAWWPPTSWNYPIFVPSAAFHPAIRWPARSWKPCADAPRIAPTARSFSNSWATDW